MVEGTVVFSGDVTLERSTHPVDLSHMSGASMKKIIASSTALLMLQCALPALAQSEPQPVQDFTLPEHSPRVIAEPVGLNQPVSVAVLDLESRPEDAALSQALADVLRIHLFKAPGIQVLERSRLRDLLSEQRLQDSAYCGESCIAKAGKILGLDDVIVGAVHRIDGFYSIHLRIVKVSTGRVTGVATAQCKCDIEELLTRTSVQLSEQLLENVYANVHMGQVQLQSEPQGAWVYYKSKALGTTPLELQRMPVGQHEFEIVMPQFVPQKLQVDVRRHQIQRESIHLTHQNESASLEIHSQPPGAQLKINGEVKGVTPLKVPALTRGIYNLELSAPGHQNYRHHVMLEKGQHLMYDAVLQADAAPRRTQALRLLSNPPGAAVFIDNKEVGKTPFVAQFQQARSLDVSVRQMGYVDWHKSLEIKPGQALTVDAELQPNHQALGLWTAAGVGVALLLGGLFFQRSQDFNLQRLDTASASRP